MDFSLQEFKATEVEHKELQAKDSSLRVLRVMEVDHMNKGYRARATLLRELTAEATSRRQLGTQCTDRPIGHTA